MGFFINSSKQKILSTKSKILNELDAGGEPLGDDDAAGAEADTSSNDNTTEADSINNTQSDTDNTADQNQNDSNEDAGGNNDEEETEDYTSSTDDDNWDNDENNSGGGSDSSSSSGSSSYGNDAEDSKPDDLKTTEEELYDNLTPEQLDIKHKELKDQYGRMYDMIMSLIDRIGDVSPSEENIGTMQYVSKTLSTLKDMIIDYISKVYQTKSYIENSINYGRFLAQLNGINKILEEMNSKNEEN